MFTSQYVLDYRGVQPDLTITFSRFIEYMQETSLRHTQSTPYPMEWFSENSKGFFLTNWQVKIIKYPKWNDRITIKTWPIYFKGVIAERTFSVTNEMDETIALANSKWCFTDIQRHRPVKVPTDVADSYGECALSELTPDYSFKSNDAFTKLSEDTIKVTRREIDTNNHVNNVKYIEWASDSVPDEIYQRYRIVQMKASYKKQCVSGSTALVETWVNQTQNGHEIISVIYDCNDPTQIYTEIYTLWADTSND